MNRAEKTHELVGQIEKNGKPELAVLLLLVGIFHEKKKCAKERGEYLASLNAIRKLNRNSRKKSVQEAIDLLCEIRNGGCKESETR